MVRSRVGYLMKPILVRLPILLGVLLALGLSGGLVGAQGPSPAQIQAALRAFLATPHTWSGAQTFGAISCSGCSTPLIIGDTQVAYATAANTIGGDAGLTYNGTTDTLSIGGVTGADISGTGGGNGGLLFTHSAAGTTQFKFKNLGAGDAEISAYDATEFTGITIKALPLDGGAEVFAVGTPGDLVLRADGAIRVRADVIVADGQAIKTDTTTAHTALLQAYDVNGTTYKTFGTLTNGDVPDFTIAAPAGGSLSVGGMVLTTAVVPAMSGTRFLCISTLGVVTSSTTACSGT